MKIQTFLFLIVLSSTVFANGTATPIEILRKENHGILSEKDLKAAEVSMVDIPYRGGLGISYWACFRTEDIRFDCTDDQHFEPGWGRVATETITARHGNEEHDYYFRRGMTLYFCESLLKEWNRIKTNEAYACFSGYPSGEEIISTNIAKKVNYGWTLDKMKTTKGCVAYFGLSDGCQ